MSVYSHQDIEVEAPLPTDAEANPMDSGADCLYSANLSANYLDINCLNNSSADVYEDYGLSPYPDFTQIPFICITFISCYFVVMFLALFGNAAVCYTVMSNRKMQTVVNYYIVNLAICDFMVGAFVLPVKLLELTAPASWRALNDGLCTAMMYLQTVFVFASVLTLVATCLERYFAIVHPLESRIAQSKSRTIRILILVWLLPCIGASPYLYPGEAIANTLTSDYGTITRLTCFTRFSPSFRRAYFTFLFVFFYLIPLSFIAWTCFRIAQCLLKGTVFCRQGSLRRQEINRRKVAKMVLVVVAAFSVSWTPYFLVTIITQYQEVNFMREHNYFFTMLCISLLAFINSSVNPFIYVVMSTRFRNGFSRIFRCLLCASEGVDEGGTLPPRAPKPFACLTKYHRQMVLLACREPTQISTDSLPTDSGQHTAVGSFKNVIFHSVRDGSWRVTPNCLHGHGGQGQGQGQSEEGQSKDTQPPLNPVQPKLTTSKSLHSFSGQQDGETSPDATPSSSRCRLPPKARSESFIRNVHQITFLEIEPVNGRGPDVAALIPKTSGRAKAPEKERHRDRNRERQREREKGGKKKKGQRKGKLALVEGVEGEGERAACLGDRYVEEEEEEAKRRSQMERMPLTMTKCNISPNHNHSSTAMDVYIDTTM